MKRVQKTAIQKDLEKKMVLLVGPRQAGKTWLAKDIAQDFEHALYLNYDNFEDKEIIHRQNWLPSVQLLILDELHKRPNWKNFLKGVYDTKPAHMRLIVTGSARLDLMNKLGDDLAGRFFLHHLLPLSPAELSQLGTDVSIDKLIQKSGFPEPFLATESIDVERWRMQYINSLLSSEIFEIDNIQDINAMRLVFELLRSRVGSPISYQSIAEDANISAKTVKKYIAILEALYVVFRVTPYAKNISRSLMKEPKIYFFDTGLVKGDEGIKLENFVAGCLLKHTYAKIDYEARSVTLHYLRTKDGLEVDFALVEDEEIKQIIEVKSKNKEISKPLYAFHEKYHFPAIQLVKELRLERLQDGIQIMKASHYLKNLKL